MARRDDVLGVTGAETIIGPDVKVKGNLTSDSDMLIDGQIIGDVRAIGDVTIGVNGHIKADIQGLTITIAGEVEGNITAEGEVTIRETGRLTGDVTASGLTIASGGLFSGRSQIKQRHELEHQPEDGQA